MLHFYDLYNVFPLTHISGGGEEHIIAWLGFGLYLLVAGAVFLTHRDYIKVFTFLIGGVVSLVFGVYFYVGLMVISIGIFLISMVLGRCR